MIYDYYEGRLTKTIKFFDEIFVIGDTTLHDDNIHRI